MSEKCVVRLADVADKLEEVTDHWEQFLNIRSGEFVALADGVYVDKDEALAN